MGARTGNAGSTEVTISNKPLDSMIVTASPGPIDADVRLPGSKSYTNRALIVAALANGESTLAHALFSEDTRYMASALRALGIEVEESIADEVIRVKGGSGNIKAPNADLFIGNSGTSSRFLTALVALGHGRYRIDGIARMRERPIAPLLTALRQLGVSARDETGNGCPPVVVESSGFEGGTADIPGNISSQFISALMMVAPITPRGIDLRIVGDLVSRPYLDLTANVMAAFGAQTEVISNQRIFVPGNQHYVGRAYDIEPDASGASYFFAAAALTGGRVKVMALSRSSAQGDLKLVDVLAQMGCAIHWHADGVEVHGPARLHGVDIDMGEMSDVAQTLAAIAPFADSPVRIRGISHIRHKETDRISAVTTELRRLGATVTEHDDGWEIWPSALHPALVHTYDDHRMAMSFAVTGLRVADLSIADPSCVAKTFPDFFERFGRLTTPHQ